MSKEIKLNTVEEALLDFQAGKMVVIVDDRERENEGDLVVAAEKVTPEIISFMLNHGKGLICLSLTENRLRELEIPLQAQQNTSLFGTNFTVSIDSIDVLGFGVTAKGRARTILQTVADTALATDFIKPGYVFPLAAVEGGVLKRRGQTEGSVDLAKLGGLKPAAVICEIMSSDGKMLRGKDLENYCLEHKFKLISIEQIVQYRLHKEVSIRRIEQLNLRENIQGFRSEKLFSMIKEKSKLPLEIVLYVDDVDGKEHFVIIIGKPKNPSLVRVHSECLTGDVFASRRCDCGDQLNLSLERMIQNEQGILIYLNQEGRGIGLGNKLKAYSLQEQGLDTVDANLHLGFAIDARSYRVAAQILQDLGINKIKLLTNNPSKIESLSSYGVEVLERISLNTEVDEFNKEYLSTKKEKLGHLLD